MKYLKQETKIIESNISEAEWNLVAKKLKEIYSFSDIMIGALIESLKYEINVEPHTETISPNGDVISAQSNLEYFAEPLMLLALISAIDGVNIEFEYKTLKSWDLPIAHYVNNENEPIDNNLDPIEDKVKQAKQRARNS